MEPIALELLSKHCHQLRFATRALWERLGELERAAVAEVVHGPTQEFDAAQFRAKYGNDPNWGERDRWSRWVSASPLQLFLYQGVIPDDLLARLQEFVPRPPDAALESLDGLPAEIEHSGEYYNHETRKRETGLRRFRSSSRSANAPPPPSSPRCCG